MTHTHTHTKKRCISWAPAKIIYISAVAILSRRSFSRCVVYIDDQKKPATHYGGLQPFWPWLILFHTPSWNITTYHINPYHTYPLKISQDPLSMSVITCFCAHPSANHEPLIWSARALGLWAEDFPENLPPGDKCLTYLSQIEVSIGEPIINSVFSISKFDYRRTK